MPDVNLTIDASVLAAPWAAPAMPIGVLDLATVAFDDRAVHLPPFPVVGLGDRAHPLAARLDAVIEPPATLRALVAHASAHAEAAAVLVLLLRLLDGLPLGAALVAESLAYAVLQGSAGHAAWLARRVAAAALPPGRVALGRSEGVLTVTLDRPAAGNAIDRPMRDGLREAFELAALDPDIRQVRLDARGKAFSLGADLAEFGTTRDPATAHAIRMRTLPAHAIAACADKLEAHVDGACIGAGLEMAAFARRLTASPRSWFQLPELAMGLIPGAGGCVSLARRIGRQRTALLVLSGRRIGARTALDWGLVDALVCD